MRRMLGIGVVALLVLGVAGMTHAAPVKWQGTLKVELGTLGPAVVTGRTGVATLNSSAGVGNNQNHLNTIQIAGTDFMTTRIVPVTDPESAPIVRVDVTITNVLGTLAFGSNTTAMGSDATLPVRGTAKICLFDPACLPGGFLPLNLTTHATGSTTSGVGIGGFLTVGGAGMVRISITANPWTLGQGTSIDQVTLTTNGAKVFQVVHSTGFAHGPDSLASSTASTSGVIKFITPLQVTTNITNGSNELVSLFSTLKLHFVPEPGMLLLLGSGVVGLVLLGRHRMKK